MALTLMGVQMNQWPRDLTADKVAFYGDFRMRHWADTHLVRVYTPFVMYYEKLPMKRGILAHERIALPLTTIFTEIWEACGHDQAAVDRTGASEFGGCFNIRKIAGSDNWSNHSWACAIDLAPSTNGFRYDASTTLPNIVIDAFKREGFRWGGDYKGRKDPMHFEAVSPA